MSRSHTFICIGSLCGPWAPYCVYSRTQSGVGANLDWLDSIRQQSRNAQGVSRNMSVSRLRMSLSVLHPCAGPINTLTYLPGLSDTSSPLLHRAQSLAVQSHHIVNRNVQSVPWPALARKHTLLYVFHLPFTSIRPALSSSLEAL